MTRVTEWVMGIVGGIAAFLGLFILFGGENEYLGLGGDNLTWRVGDIESGWGYGLAIGGVVLLVATVALVMWDVRHPRVHRPQSEFTGLMWHAGIFVVVNAFLWIQDIAAGGGLEYAFWTTIPWGVGLIIHALTYVFAGRRVEAFPEDRTVEEIPKRELQHH
jgi:hypothetical protein